MREGHDPHFRGLVSDPEAIETLADGFWFLEGPVWVPERDDDPAHLLFNDIPGQVRRRWDLDGTITEVARPTNFANGMTLDHQGRLIICEHGTSRVIRLEPRGSITLLADQHDGRGLNSPNDVIVADDGAVWFTDPRYGRRGVHGIERSVVMPYCGVYRIADPDAGSAAVLMIDDLETPNGLCFSPDRRYLYVDDTESMRIHRYTVATDGSLSDAQVFFDMGQPFDGAAGFPDGLKCDERGNLWVSGPGGIWVIGPDGRHVGSIATPTVVANFCWGGPQGTWLFICASDRLLRLRTNVHGA
jgi:gluconolactonase